MINKAILRDSMQLFGGPGYDPQARDQFIEEIKAGESAKIMPLLAELFSDPDLDIRANAITASLIIDQMLGLDLILPYLADPDWHMRYHVCGLMNEYGDQRAIEPLLQILKNDSDPQIRGVAAFALGGIGHVSVIVDLVQTARNDYEIDTLGYTPGQSARQAIHYILLEQVVKHISLNSNVKIRQSYPTGGILEGNIIHLSKPINWDTIHEDLPGNTFQYTTSRSIQDESLHPFPFLAEVSYEVAKLHVDRKFVFTSDDKSWAIGIYLPPESDDSQQTTF